MKQIHILKQFSFFQIFRPYKWVCEPTPFSHHGDTLAIVMTFKENIVALLTHRHQDLDM